MLTLHTCTCSVVIIVGVFLQSLERSSEECKAAEIRKLYNGLSVRSEESVWVLTSWLKAWLGRSLSAGNKEALEPLELCRHHKYVSVGALL